MNESGGLRVIGAGFGRTGTSSLKEALEILGFGPCHHMDEVIRHPEEVPTWEAAARGEPVDWVSFLAPWGSCVDWPSALHYAALAEAFPDAKVILGTRDPDRWYDSFVSTIVPMLTRFPNRLLGPWLPAACGPFRSTSKLLFGRILAGRDPLDRAQTLAAFHEHHETVKRTIPPERLLVFKPEDGWEPLCAHLGVPVPDRAFPRVNDTADFQRRARLATAVCWVLLFCPPLLLLAAAVSSYQRRRPPVLLSRPEAKSLAG